MVLKRIYLDEENKNVYLDAYIADEMPGLVRKAMLVIPGGGYQNIYPPEGDPVAMAFMPYGYNAFVLHYTVSRNGVNGTFPKQLIEASKAIKHIKDNAKEYNIDPEELFAVGFSAGGHLAGSLATMWNLKEVYDAIDMEYGYNKLKGAILIYPVVTAMNLYTIDHEDTFKHLLGSDFGNQEIFEKVSLERHVSKDSCPIFMTLCANDVVVNAKNALCLAEAYADNDMPYELHIYPDSKHGFCLGNKITKCNEEKWEDASIAKWVENAVYWANRL